MGVLFLFVDGIGLGASGDSNPLSVHDFPGLQHLTDGQKLISESDGFTKPSHLFTSIDACLGVEGLPQSGTGQATLFSGENASTMIGKHFGPFPHSGNKPLLTERSLFHQLQQNGLQPYFINAFPKIFFERSAKRNRWSCATLMTRSAGQPLNSVEEVRNGDALTAEILQDYWKSMLQLDIPEISFREAAQRVVRSLDQYDLVLMEYYLTDKAGHSQVEVDAVRALQRLDGFISAFSEVNRDHSLVLTSDHGNIEDLSTKTHTINEVPLIVTGPIAGHFSDVKDLTGVTPAIIHSLVNGR